MPKNIEKRKKRWEKYTKKWEENPIVMVLDDSPISNITNSEHIKNLQEILVQVCIDYIKDNNLTDIWGISFNVDDLNTSAEYGKWTSATDSYIKVEGIRKKRFLRKSGEIFEMPYRHTIGERM